MRRFSIDERRAETILAGAIVLDEIMRKLEIEQLRACDAALREGIVEYVLDNLRAPRKDGGSVRRSSVLGLVERSDVERAHATHVARLALRIFDQTQDLHRFRTGERELLEYAALLHEVGMHVSYQDHQKHSYYLISHAGLRGFTTDQVAIVANVARYYRKAAPSRSTKTSRRSRRRSRTWCASWPRCCASPMRSTADAGEPCATSASKRPREKSCSVRACAATRRSSWKRRPAARSTSERCSIAMSTSRKAAAPSKKPPEERLLVLLRHGIAEEASADKKDEDRGLTSEGHARMKEIARGLVEALPKVQAIYTSPLLRAVQTALWVSKGYKSRVDDQRPATPSRPAPRRKQFRALVDSITERRVILVGHEPNLSTNMAALTGIDRAKLELKKGGCYGVRIAPDGSATLEWLLTPRVLRKLGT